MGRMKEIDLVLRTTDEHLADIDNKLDAMLHLLRDMVTLEAKIEKVDQKIDERLTSLTDRIIEMAMVKSGEPESAVRHRAQSRLETEFSTKGSWEAEEPDEDPWPPAGCKDVLEIT